MQRSSTSDKLVVLVYKCLHGITLSYLADELQWTADLESRRHLRSASSLSLAVCRTWLSTVGDRVFPIAAAHTWNNLSQHVTSAPSMSVFRRRLKVFGPLSAFRPVTFTATFVVTIRSDSCCFNRSFYLLVLTFAMYTVWFLKIRWLH